MVHSLKNQIAKFKEKINQNQEKSEFDTNTLERIIEGLRELGALFYELCMYEYAENCYPFTYEIFKHYNGEKQLLGNLEYLLELDGLSIDLKKKNPNELNEKFGKDKEKYKNYRMRIEDVSPKQTYNFLNIGKLFELNAYFKSALDIYRIYKKILQSMRVNNYNPYYIKACLLKANLLTNLYLF